MFLDFITGSLNCAAFIAGIVEAVLHGCNFVSSPLFSQDFYQKFSHTIQSAEL